MTYDEPRRDRVGRAVTGTVYFVGLLVTDLVADGALGRNTILAAVALAAPALAAFVWGARTRPKHEAAWWILGLLAVTALLATGQIVLTAALLVGLFLAHDLQLTPSLMLAGGILAALIQPAYGWTEATETTGWWIATAVLLTTVAAILERDRMAWRDGQPVHPAWSAARVAFVGLWTFVIMAFRERIEAGRVFALLGAEPTGFAGQMLLLAILLTALVVAGFLFRTRKPPEGTAS